MPQPTDPADSVSKPPAETEAPRGGAAPPMGPPGMRGMGGFGGGRFMQRGPAVKPKDMKGTLFRLWAYLGRERKWLLFIMLFVILDAGLVLVGPYLIGRAVDAMAAKNGVDLKFLETVILGLAAAYLADGFLVFLQGWLVAGVSQRTVMLLRRTLFRKLQKLPLAFFDSRTNGEVMSRLTNDVDNVSTSLAQTIAQLMSGALVIAGSLTMMIVLSPLLTLASIITLPMVILLVKTITKRTSRLFKNQQVQLGRLNGLVEETISGIVVVKAFNHEEKAIAAFEEANAQLREVGLKAQIWSGFLMPILNVINNAGFAAVAVLGGVLAVQGNITVGVIASFLSYSRQFVRPMTEVANVFNVLQSGVAGAERVFEVIDEEEETADSAGMRELVNPRGHVVFDNVTFGYSPDRPILKNVSFEAPAASSTALVGPTGAGKTTIANLVTRFYDVTKGRITIDGIDIREYTRDSLRRSFGIVLQDTYLFSGTIKENILYGKPDATDEEVRAAAEMANAHDFISQLPKQYDTELAENGGNLSQGQRQLLAIARVMLAKPSLLILDEATSSIDTRTELHIQDALAKIMQGRTSFIIAHRLNTIRDADTIMVIDGGEIVERGSHEQLIRQQGSYHRMFVNQFH